MTATVWQLVSEHPSLKFQQALLVHQRELLTLSPQSGQPLNHQCYQLLLTISVALSLIQARVLWTGGRRLQQRGQHMCTSFPVEVLGSFRRKGTAGFIHTLQLVHFAHLQVRVITGISEDSPRSFLCQLGSQVTYIGQGSQARKNGSAHRGHGKVSRTC